MLKNKIAVITGGTRGIGYAVVQRYLANGAAVALFGSRQETVDRALTSLREEFPNGKMMGLAPKLSNYAEVESAFAEVQSKFGGLDILVNNAGISARESIFDYRPEDFQKIMDLNVTAVFFCCKAAATMMKEQGRGGVILSTSSMVTKYGQPSGCGYPASKMAVNGLTLSLARELAPYQIRVNAVAPGVTRTDMVAALPKEMLDRLAQTIPFGRVGEPAEVADAFLYLASDLAGYVTGTILSVDGGARS